MLGRRNDDPGLTCLEPGREVRSDRACELIHLGIHLHRVIARVAGVPRNRLLRLFTGTRGRHGHGKRMVASFTTHGASFAIATITEPVNFHVIFTGRPSKAGRCSTQTVFFVPRSLHGTLRSLAIMYTLLHDDRKILEGLTFTPAYADRTNATTVHATKTTGDAPQAIVCARRSRAVRVGTVSLPTYAPYSLTAL